MTSEQKTELQKALERIQNNKLHWMNGKDRKTGKTIWCVENRRATKKNGHLVFHVVYKDNQGKFHCDCPYGQRAGNVCIHKAIAYSDDVTSEFCETKPDSQKLAEQAKEREESICIPQTGGPRFHRGKR